MVLEKLGEYATTEIADLKDLKKIPTGSGIYVMIYMENGKPKSIPRLNGKSDTEGILCIGKAVNLNRRILDFHGDVFDETLYSHSHSEGWNFRRYFRDNDFPQTIKLNAKNIRVCWTELESEKDADKLETDCIQYYIMKFQDKPPLNISIKRLRERRPGNKSKNLQT